jgi:hypothetical protein
VIPREGVESFFSATTAFRWFMVIPREGVESSPNSNRLEQFLAEK